MNETFKKLNLFTLTVASCVAIGYGMWHYKDSLRDGLDNITTLDKKSFPSIVYEDVGDSLKLYTPRKSQVKNGLNFIFLPDSPIGTVAKSDVKFVDDIPVSDFKRHYPVSIRGEFDFHKTDGCKYISSYIENSILTDSTMKKLNAYIDYAKSQPDFSEIERVKIYGSKNKDDFFREITKFEN